MKGEILAKLLVFAVLVNLSNQTCRLTNNCTGTDANCVPYETITDEDKTPKMAAQSIEGVCPDFLGKNVCCNEFIIQSMLTKFALLEEALGSPGTGCSICATNLKRFYCQFNCDPGQADWMSAVTKINYYGVSYPVSSVNATISYEETCQIYNTCSAINFISALGASASPQGFFNLQSSQGVPQGNILINYTYQTPTSQPQVNVYNSTTYSCDNDYSKNCKDNMCPDPSGYALYQQPWCGCGACSQNCTAPDFSQYIQARTLASGFNGWTVLITFGVVLFVIILSGIYSTVKTHYKKKLRKISEDSMAEVDHFI